MINWQVTTWIREVEGKQPMYGMTEKGDLQKMWSD